MTVVARKGSVTNDDGEGPRGQSLVKNVFVFYLRMPQLCKSVHNAYRSKSLLRLNMHLQRSLIQTEDTNKIAIAVRVLQNTGNLVISRCWGAYKTKATVRATSIKR